MKVKMNSQKGEPNVLIKFFCQCQKKRNEMYKLCLNQLISKL